MVSAERSRQHQHAAGLRFRLHHSRCRGIHAAVLHATGRDGIENMDYYIAYNMFRLAGIIQGIVGRVRDGTASNAHAAAMADRVKPLSDMGWEYAMKAGAERVK